jgi:hypothetical protein
VSRYCFITGFLRSGTTLVEKLVHSLPGACIGPQPFPFVYQDVKRAFLRSLGGGDERYPLGHLFREDRYVPADFASFLAEHRVTREALAASFARMEGYSGWKLPALAAATPDVPGGSLAETYRALCDALPHILGRESATLLGAKEVFSEEFAPYLLGERVTVLLVVRDPRDVFTSLKRGRGSTYVDRGLAALHIVRQWRKSVAFALELEGRAGFQLVRYEDLVARPLPMLTGLARDLGVGAPAPHGPALVLDQDGAAWAGNSSFGALDGVSPSAIGRFAHEQPRTRLALAEALSAPEMRAMGYPMVPAPPPAGRGIEKAVEGVGTEFAVVGRDDDLSEEIALERERARMLAAGDAERADQGPWFTFRRAYERLATEHPSARRAP